MRRFCSCVLASAIFLSTPVLAEKTFSLGAARSTYRVGSGDVLKVGIYYAPIYDDSLKIAGEYAVLPDGTLSLPLVGTLPVAGLEVAEVTSLLNERYSTYFKHAVVSVNLGALRPVRVILTGEVVHPGPYELKPGGTLGTLLQTAGGLADTADVRQVQLTRELTGTKTLNLWDLITEKADNRDILLEDGDRIAIPKSLEPNSSETSLLASSTLGQGKLKFRILGDINAYVALDPVAAYVPVALKEAGVPINSIKDFDVQLERVGSDGQVTKKLIPSEEIGLKKSDALLPGDVIVVTKKGKPFNEAIWEGFQAVVSPLRDLIYTLVLFRNLR